jgi:hypothetical protein
VALIGGTFSLSRDTLWVFTPSYAGSGVTISDDLCSVKTSSGGQVRWWCWFEVDKAVDGGRVAGEVGWGEVERVGNMGGRVGGGGSDAEAGDGAL